MREMTRKFGRLRTALFWIHAFEEPFYSLLNFEQLAKDTLFGEGETRFMGILCCLILRKEVPDMPA
jgi:hypothetical protein